MKRSPKPTPAPCPTCPYVAPSPGSLWHHARACIGSANPTLDDLYRLGRVVDPQPGECHEWRRRRGEDGYGILPDAAAAVVGERVASRAAVKLATGEPIPDGQYVLHSCDNPPCINVEHLRAGTAGQNSTDMVKRGRWRGGAKLGRTRIGAATGSR